MKSVGLLQMMLQAGMLIPADPSSEIGVFEQFFTDIGDQQSLEDDLSTYSSHLQNMKTFLDHANEKTLVLIDEFGSGTDPKIGGAIAEAILNELNRKKVFGVMTTHYSNLKIFAYNSKGIVNGSMNFDTENLSPTYQMKIGRPGSSYGFEIAQKNGLDKKILKYAKHKTGKNEKAVDQLLVDLQRDKQAAEEQLKAVQDREKQLAKLIKSYENMHKEYEFKRKKLKLDIKQQELQQTARDNKDLEKLIREIREEQNLEKAKALAAQQKESKKELSSSVNELTEDLYYKDVSKEIKQGEIRVGDFVKLKTGTTKGKVESINKKNVVLIVGALRMTVKLRDLEHTDAPMEVQKNRGIQSDLLSTPSAFKTKIDIRGMRKAEALQSLQEYIDQALIANVPSLEIVHGKGDGVLRLTLKQKLKEYKEIASVTHPPEEMGGNGVTIVEFN